METTTMKWLCFGVTSRKHQGAWGSKLIGERIAVSCNFWMLTLHRLLALGQRLAWGLLHPLEVLRGPRESGGKPPQLGRKLKKMYVPRETSADGLGHLFIHSMGSYWKSSVSAQVKTLGWVLGWWVGMAGGQHVNLQSKSHLRGSDANRKDTSLEIGLDLG